MKKLILGLLLTTIALPAFAETKPFRLEVQMENAILLGGVDNSFENIKTTSVTKFKLVDVQSQKVIMDNYSAPTSTTNIERDFLTLRFIGDRELGLLEYSSISRTDFLGDARREFERQGALGKFLAAIIIPILRESINEVASNDNVTIEGDYIVVRENQVVSADVKDTWKGHLKSFIVPETEMNRVVQNSMEAQSKMIALLIEAQVSQRGMSVDNVKAQNAGSSKLECKKASDETLSCANVASAIITMDVTK